MDRGHIFVIDRLQAMAATARSQHGVISWLQLQAIGFTRGMIRYAVRTGRLQKVLPDVYLVAGSPYTWLARQMAAVLWAGEGGAAARAAAARLHGWERFRSANVEVAVAGDRVHRGLPFTVHRYDDYLLRDIVSVEGIPCTSPRRTLLDLFGAKDARTPGALDQVLREGTETIGTLSRFYEEEWTTGRRGIAILRAELLERDPSLAPADSELGRLLWNVIVRFRLPRPVREHPLVLPTLGPIRIDLAYPRVRLAIEGDSYAWHMNREAFERDRVRDAELQALGWTVLRFTWSQLRFHPDYVAATIRSHLGRLTAA